MPIQEAPASVQFAADTQRPDIPESVLRGSALQVRFYKAAVLDWEATNGQTLRKVHPETGAWVTEVIPGSLKTRGVPTYRDVDMVEIGAPGDVGELRQREVREIDKQRWPRQWEAYQAGQDQGSIGTPLSEVRDAHGKQVFSKARILEFAAAKVNTAEQIRDMADSNAQRFMGLQADKQKVIEFLARAKEEAPQKALEAAVKEKDEEIKALHQLLDEQGKRIDALAKGKKV